MGQDEIEKAIEDLFERIHKLEMEMSDMVDDIDRLLQRLREPGAAQQEGYSRPVPVRGNKRQPGSSAKLREVLIKTAKAGVAKVELLELPKGRAKLTIDGGPGVKLSPVLTNLMRALTADSGDSIDGLVGFKAPFDLARVLAKFANKEVKRHTVCEAVRRLRQALAAGNYNPYLVQSDRRWGYRFALRRRGDDDVITTDPL